MYKFRNIDSFKPGRFERVGMLKGKRWYMDIPQKGKTKLGLFKPQRYEFKDKKVFCGNHYGEFIGYLLADNALVNACKVELAELSEYYANIHKFRNGGTPEHKNGCITYSKLEAEDTLEAGKLVIDKFKIRHSEEYKKVLEKGIKERDSNDSIEVFLSAIESRVRDFYSDYYRPDNKFRYKIHNDFAEIGSSEKYINLQVKKARTRAIDMIVYDCLYGNNDRHDENWSMNTTIGFKSADIGLYDLYDNERVLGLYETQNVIESSLKDDNVEEASEKILFSRMKIPGETKECSTYKDVLNYMMLMYPEETSKSLKRQMEFNTPEVIEEFLENCEGLPRPYIDFGTRVYKSRFEFAKELLNRQKQTSKDEIKTIDIKFPSKVVLPKVALEFQNRQIDYTDDSR